MYSSWSLLLHLLQKTHSHDYIYFGLYEWYDLKLTFICATLIFIIIILSIKYPLPFWTKSGWFAKTQNLITWHQKQGKTPRPSKKIPNWQSYAMLHAVLMAHFVVDVSPNHLPFGNHHWMDLLPFL